MKTVGAFEGKTHFSRLLAEVEAGETIVITKNGRPVARLTPIEPKPHELDAENAFAALLGMSVPLGIDARTLLEESRRA